MGDGSISPLDAEYIFHVFQMVLRELRIRGNTWEYVGMHEGNTEYAHTRRTVMYSMRIREFLPAPREFSILPPHSATTRAPLEIQLITLSR